MEIEYKNEILKEVFDFFQYSKRDDKILLSKALDNIDYNGSSIIFKNINYNVGEGNKESKLLGFFLANIPIVVNGIEMGREDLTLKLMKLKNDTSELIKTNKFNELSTLEIYLLLEMGLRCSYSKWLGKKVIISRYGYEDIVLYNRDYRKLKLYLRLNKMSHYDIKVNNEIFPSSQNSLLSWADRFLDKYSSLIFRLTLNVRNLLAHGENEWDLYPQIESLETSSFLVGKLMDRINFKN